MGRTSDNLVQGLGNLFLGRKEINAELFEELESRLLMADVGVDAGEVGLAHALTTVVSASPKPPKSAGEKVTDEGDGGERIAAYLVGQKLI